MFRWLCVSTMKTFTPDWVLCAVAHGDLGRDPAWPLSWKTPCLHLNVSVQMSGIWSWGGFLWVTVLFSEWSSMALPGVSSEVGLLAFPSDEFTFPGAHQDTSGRLPGCCSVSKSVQLFVTPWTVARQASLASTISWSLLKFMSVESVMPSAISSSLVPFSSCLQSFPASGPFPMSQLFP